MKALAAAAMLWAGAAGAADLALVVGNEDYRTLQDVASADDMLRPADSLQEQGFRVFAMGNADAVRMAELLAAFVAEAGKDDTGRIVVALNGHWMTSGEDSYLLPVDAPADQNLAILPRIGLPLSVVLPVLARHPGRAVLVLGDSGATGQAGAFLTHGAQVQAPQGVTVFQGPASAASWFVTTALVRPDLRLAEAAGRISGLRTDGYLPADFVLLGTARPQAPVPLPDPDPAAESQFWQATRRADTIAAYEAYLRRYPEGPHAAEADRLIQEIRTEPNRPARLAEEALALTRDQRREIQRALSLLGHDTRGVDGVFGPGSRAAIAEWQTRYGLPATSYLTRDQIAALAQQADVRAAELEREAEARRLEQERQDRAYWAATGAVGDEAGLRSYLARYPDGIFAELAQDRLEAIEEAKRAAAAQADRAAWDLAQKADTLPAYRGYLSDYPRGAFAEEAKARIAELEDEAEQSDAIKRAQERERALDLNEQTRMLVERRLDALELRPGPVDGTFDPRTRRAIRRYQQQRDLEPTGYIDQGTLVRIMADAVLR